MSWYNSNSKINCDKDKYYKQQHYHLKVITKEIKLKGIKAYYLKLIISKESRIGRTKEEQRNRLDKYKNIRNMIDLNPNNNNIKQKLSKQINKK